MKILFLTYQGDLAGSTNSIYYLTTGMAARGHEIYVGCRKESLLHEMLRDSEVRLIPMTFRSKFDSVNIWQIKTAVEEYGIEIINAQSSLDRYTSIMSKLKYSLNVKVVHTRRQVSKSKGGVLQSLFYMGGTSKIVAVSAGVKKSLIRNGIKPSHIEVIYNGTPESKYNCVSAEKALLLRSKHAIKPGEFVIGCVSRRKNQEELIHALSQLKFSFKMLFIGIEAESDLQKLVDSYNLRDQVEFLGELPTELVLNYYQLFHAMVLPSTMEGLSQSLLEAMYLRVPVIATRAAGNIDLIQDQVNGLLYNKKDIKGLVTAINSIYNRTIDLNLLINNGHMTAKETYSIDRTISNYEQFFENLLLSKKQWVAASL